MGDDVLSSHTGFLLITLKPEGIFVPNITPFNKKGEIMYDKLAELVEHWIKEGVSGIVANASTGEAPYLSRDEKMKLIEFIKEQTDGRINVYAGTGAMSTWQTIELTKDAKEAGAEAALITTPFFFKPNDEEIAQYFIDVINAVDLPVTLKMRTGIDPKHRNAVELAKIAENLGIQAVTLHGRTRADKFHGQAEYDTIKAVKQALKIPVIANGDICHPNQADFVLKYTLSDGIMIGRAAQGYPWIFREIRHFLTTGDFLDKPLLSEFHQVMLRHFTELETLYGSQLGFKLARKHCGWYSQYLPNGNQLRKQFNQLESTQAQLKLIDQYFETHTLYDQ
jgi:nifR3 family TIM-barrel protein